MMDTTQDNIINVPAKRPRGRPRKPKVKRKGRQPRFKTAFIKRAQRIMAKGFSETELAKVFDVSQAAVSKWKTKHPEFGAAIEQGRRDADSTIQRSLFQRAKGYKHRDEYVSQYRGEIIRTPITKHYAPDTQALQFWLKNRVPEQWQDRVQVESEGIAGFLAALGGHALASGPANRTDRKAIECQVVDDLQPGEHDPAKQVNDTSADGS